MSKNTRTRILLTAVAALLLVVMAVGGTIAYLQDVSSTVVNNFEPTKIDVDLTETKATYTMIPGHTIDKDPVVTLKANSVASYVFVKIERSTNLAFNDYMTFAIAEGWIPVEEETDVWYREQAATTTDVSWPVLLNNKVTVKSEVSKTMMDAVTDANKPSLTITAYAVQQMKDNTTKFTVAEAWDVAPDNVLTPANP